MHAISISKLKKKYLRGIKQEIIALKGLDLEIAQGEIFGFLGPNGAGKSTTIKLLLNIIRPSGGTAKIFGTDVRNPLARKRLGYLPETPSYYDYLTARELLWFVGKTYHLPLERIKKRTPELLELVGLREVENVRIRKYSKGMVQRLGLAQVLIHNPDLLILDEPTSGLDPLGRKLVADLLLNLKKEGKTIFFSSHILHDAETICDRVGILAGGEMRFQGKISELLYKSVETFDLLLQVEPEVSELNPENNLKTETRLTKELEQKSLSYKVEGSMIRLRIKKKDLWPLLGFVKEKNLNLFAVEPQRKKLEDVFLKFI